MIVFLNGAFVPEEKAAVSVFDRGFLYGDGLFETLRLYQGKPFRWEQHHERLLRGAEFLKIKLPFSADQLRLQAEELSQRNAMPEAVLRLVLSRGVGKRGYSPKGAAQPVLVMSLHPAPAISPEHPLRWRLLTSTLRVPTDDPLARYKTCNKLHHILARAEAEAKGADEALLLNSSGEVVEASSGNLFWIHDQAVCTTPLASGALPGITRGVIFEICRSLSLPCQEKHAVIDSLWSAEGVFLTMSGLEVVEVVRLDGRELARSPITAQIREAYRTLVSYNV